MKWSWKIARIVGVDIYLHWTFLLLISWILFSELLAGSSWSAAWLGVGMVLALFGCVVLHELGHALAARLYGVPTQDITILPIGGVARLGRIPEHPVQELVIAIAGPLVNLVIAAVLLLVLLLLNSGDLWFGAASTGHFLQNLMWANIVLVLFNLLPAFPMDGGRVLRASLAGVLEYSRATRIAATIGQAMAILFALAGLLIVDNPLLLLVALFIYLGAASEARMVETRSVLRGIPVREAMMTRFHTLSPDDSLRVAARELLAGSQQDFPVVEAGRFVGMLRRTELAQGLAESSSDTLIRERMSTEYPVVSEFDLLEHVMIDMQQGAAAVPVISGERLVGLVDTENVGEWLMIRAAIIQSGMGTTPPSVVDDPTAVDLGRVHVRPPCPH